MNVHKIGVSLFLLLAVCACSSLAVAGVTRLTVVDSSPSSWVARGYSDYTVSPDLGWTFGASRNFDNGIGPNLLGPALPGTSVSSWRLNFAAPNNAEIIPGFYDDFARFPFQNSSQPGLEFSSTGRLDNRASGFFNVLEATYDTNGDVLSFAADFTHYGEQNLNNWAIVEVRYNATIPEPKTMVLAVLSLGGMLLLRRSSQPQ